MTRQYPMAQLVIQNLEMRMWSYPQAITIVLTFPVNQKPRISLRKKDTVIRTTWIGMVMG